MAVPIELDCPWCLAGHVVSPLKLVCSDEGMLYTDHVTGIVRAQGAHARYYCPDAACSYAEIHDRPLFDRRADAA